MKNKALLTTCGEELHNLIAAAFPQVNEETEVMYERCPEELEDILNFLQPEGMVTQHFTNWGEWRVTYDHDKDTLVVLSLFSKWDDYDSSDDL